MARKKDEFLDFETSTEAEDTSEENLFTEAEDTSEENLFTEELEKNTSSKKGSDAPKDIKKEEEKVPPKECVACGPKKYIVFRNIMGFTLGDVLPGSEFSNLEALINTGFLIEESAITNGQKLDLEIRKSK